MEKVAILGRIFDPVHWGHLSIAQTAATQFALDRVIWSVDRATPHKSHSVLAFFNKWREMVALATAERPDFGLLPLDTNPYASAAIDSLLYLPNLATEAQLYWIIGADAFQTLPKWPRCAEIAGLCDWLVAPRPSHGDRVTAESGEIGGLSEWGDCPSGKPIDSGGDRMQVQANADLPTSCRTNGSFGRGNSLGGAIHVCDRNFVEPHPPLLRRKSQPPLLSPRSCPNLYYRPSALPVTSGDRAQSFQICDFWLLKKFRFF